MGFLLTENKQRSKTCFSSTRITRRHFITRRARFLNMPTNAVSTDGRVWKTEVVFLLIRDIWVNQNSEVIFSTGRKRSARLVESFY